VAITKYHPDVDPSPEAEKKFQSIVRAYAVVTGEDKSLDERTLIKNAVDNLRDDLEFKKQRIEALKAQAEEEAVQVEQMQVQLKAAEAKARDVSNELGALGGGALGLLIGGPIGAVVGAGVGLAVKDDEGLPGQFIRGVGTVAKGAAKAVNTVTDKMNEK